MSDLFIGLSAIPALLILLALRLPIAIALGVVSLLGLLIIRGPRATLAMFSAMPLEFAASWTLSAVPMFILMGAVAYHAGLTKGLFDAAKVWLGRLPGGLALATNFASAGFAAASGSSLATCAAMGKIAIPQMLEAKYDKGLAAGVVAAGGTLGVLIPPSIMFVLYGWFTGTSIAALLLAGILPGLLTAGVYGVMIFLRCRANPSLAPRLEFDASPEEKRRVLLDIWPVPLLILGVIGALYSGIATATEAAAVGALLAILIAFLKRTFSKKAAVESIKETLISSAGIFFVAIGAMLLTRFFAFAGVPNFIAQQMGILGLDPIVLILGIAVIYLVLGMFLEPMGLMLLTLPVVYPVMQLAGLDPIWSGVLIVKFLEIGLITPPVGLNIFVVKSVVGDSIPLPTIFKGLIWFLVAEIVVIGLLIAFPPISTFLPNLLLSR